MQTDLQSFVLIFCYAKLLLCKTPMAARMLVRENLNLLKIKYVQINKKQISFASNSYFELKKRDLKINEFIH